MNATQRQAQGARRWHARSVEAGPGNAGSQISLTSCLPKFLPFEQAEERLWRSRDAWQWFRAGAACRCRPAVPSSLSIGPDFHVFADDEALTFMRLISMSAAPAGCAVVAGDHAVQGDAEKAFMRSITASMIQPPTFSK